MGITDKVKNEAGDLIGKGKETVGRVLHNEDLEAEGKADQVEATVKKAGERAKDRLKDVKDSAKDVLD